MRAGRYQSSVDQGICGNHGSVYFFRPALQPFPQLFRISRRGTGSQQFFRRSVDFITRRLHHFYRIGKADRTVIQRDKQKRCFFLRLYSCSGKYAQYETENRNNSLKKIECVHNLTLGATAKITTVSCILPNLFKCIIRHISFVFLYYTACTVKKIVRFQIFITLY